MRRYILTIAALLVAVAASAQVTREVEVTKQYVPKLPPAHKLDMVTDKQDTVTIRPEIDYTIAPKSFASALSTSKFRPATVTYWEYNKRYPFYVKVGAGYPLASEVDVYATTNRADVGYITGYVNHRGQFSKIKGETELAKGEVVPYDNNSQQMTNRVGVNGGKYFGRYTLDGDVYYQSDIYHRYPQQVTETTADEVNFENIAARLTFGDSFSDLSKFNFGIYAAADYYNDKSEHLLEADQTLKLQQFSLSAGVKAARKLAERAELMISADYNGYYGSKSLENYTDNIVSATALFGYHAKRIFDMKLGVTYSFDNNTVLDKSQHHILPYLYAGADAFENGAVVPYVEFDSKLINNSYQQLQRINPYIAMPAEVSLLPNTVEYNARVGVSGHVGGNKFAYRLYGNMGLIKDALYWYSPTPAYFDAEVADQTVFSLEASLEYKPISQLYIAASAKGMIYKTPQSVEVENCKPSILGNLSIRYTHSKFAIGASADVVGATKWTVYLTQDRSSSAVVSYPTYINLKATFDWFISKQCTLYLEGRNLTNSKIHNWALYKEYGAGGVVGVKVQF